MREALRFPKLFQPGRIGKLEVRNRIIMAPMATQMANLAGTYSERQIDYLVARAKGGAGLLLTEATMVESCREKTTISAVFTLVLPLAAPFFPKPTSIDQKDDFSSPEEPPPRLELTEITIRP